MCLNFGQIKEFCVAREERAAHQEQLVSDSKKLK